MTPLSDVFTAGELAKKHIATSGAGRQFLVFVKPPVTSRPSDVSTAMLLQYPLMNHCNHTTLIMP